MNHRTGRILKPHHLAPLMAAALVAVLGCLAHGAGLARTEHFSVIAPDDATAKEVAQLAEQYRVEITREWFDSEPPQDGIRIVIRVSYAEHGTGGRTVAASEPGHKWHNVFICTSPNEPDHLRGTLKHEVCHCVFASFHPHPNRIPSELEEAIAYTYNRPATDARRAELKRRLRMWEAGR